jgi:hypothetical protein
MLGMGNKPSHSVYIAKYERVCYTGYFDDRRTSFALMRVTRAITHIPLRDVNASKLAQLDALADAYIRLCQEYTTAFCTTNSSDAYADPWIESPLSARWQRVAIQQAAGIARAWRTNRDRAYTVYLEAVAEYREQDGEPRSDHKRPEPVWREWNTPKLTRIVVQASINVVKLELSEDSSFDYWLRISTLEKGQPLRVPVKLASYHRTAIDNATINTSVTLTRKPTGWWLTLTVDEFVDLRTTEASPVVGVDVGITNFLTTSSGKRYGPFSGKLARRHKLDREKRRRKAKLRACLKKKGVQKLPSLANPRLGRHVRQEINRAVNLFYADHPDAQVAYEDLSVASMRLKTRRANAYLYAVNLSHLPKQLAWGARKRGQRARPGPAAYSSQECSVCHFVDRANRPHQRTFRCQACGHTQHADENAAQNHQARFFDQDIRACSKQEIKALLHSRHVAWKQRLVVVEPPAEFVRQPA